MQNQRVLISVSEASLASEDADCAGCDDASCADERILSFRLGWPDINAVITPSGVLAKYP